MSGINYSDKIPNNVNLSGTARCSALEQWQPNYLSWWNDMGPDGSHGFDVYLRTAISVDPQGWAHFGHVKMPDYRWGIFLNNRPRPAARSTSATTGRGRLAGRAGRVSRQPAPHHRHPGRHRARLGRAAAPPRPDRAQHVRPAQPVPVNVEEGRHLWAMVYLLHKYFGRDGREEGEALLERRSGEQDNPRILQAFNEQTPDWLSFFMFTYFTDRDGKFQLCAPAESAFDPLARTTRFMLTEEAHHMFVGESGVSRVIQRTCRVMNELKTDDRASCARPA